VPPPATERLDQRLDGVGYRRLFGLPDSSRRLDALWAEPDAPARLFDLASDAGASWHARFLACEVIFHEQMFLILHHSELFASLAEVYARALVENGSGSMYDWGFGSAMDDPGALGTRFVVFGLDADPTLRRLLDDAHEVEYIDPPDVPFRRRTRFRVQDFAALHLGRIHDLALRLTEDPAQRDAKIRRLRLILPSMSDTVR